MTGRATFGAGVLSDTSVRETMANAREAEALGFDTFWVAEDYYYGGAFATAAAVAATTERIRVGIGVVNPFTRHPAVIAMETAALDAVSGGRILLGLGASNVRWVEEQMGIPFSRPITATRECVEIVRRMLRGERIAYDGQAFQLAGVALSFPAARRDLPIWLGVKGPAALQAAGAVADGVLLSVLSSVPYLRWAVERIREGAEAAGRPPAAIAVASYLLVHLDDDAARARDALRPIVAHYMGVHYDHPIMRIAGFSEPDMRPFREALRSRADATHLVTDEMVDLLAIAGTPAHARERLAAYLEAGLTHPVAFQVRDVPLGRTLAAVREHLFHPNAARAG
ncbi:MAG: LLM class flavin-dependent oxidoreductase [Candidatus Limnocylindria bacterium]